MIPARHPEHGPEDLCPAGAEWYERAPREGHVTGTDTEDAPCLVDLGLLHPAVADLNTLEPVALLDRGGRIRTLHQPSANPP